jgi:hypothetical protein
VQRKTCRGLFLSQAVRDLYCKILSDSLESDLTLQSDLTGTVSPTSCHDQPCIKVDLYSEAKYSRQFLCKQDRNVIQKIMLLDKQRSQLLTSLTCVGQNNHISHVCSQPISDSRPTQSHSTVPTAAMTSTRLSTQTKAIVTKST